MQQLLPAPQRGDVPLGRPDYRRFGLSPDPEFVEIHPGRGAQGIRLSRYEALAQLIPRLQILAREAALLQTN